MSGKNKKQFGIWMDAQQATIVGRENTETGSFTILGHEKFKGQGSNSNENASNNAERTLQAKYFKEIASHMQNAEELHVTGTGQVQEQFIKYMTETPQFKNTTSNQCTSNKMSDDKLVTFFTERFS
jgi:stalled ribosome rescue protein Dom34